jgi:putative ABC transport system permease protein
VQAAIVAALALLVLLLTRREGIRMQRQGLEAMVRGIVQIVLVGLVLGAMLRGPWVVGIIALAIMIVVAAIIASRRVRDVPHAFTIALVGIAVGGASTTALMALAGVIQLQISDLVPVGSMIIANCMNTCAQAMERFRSDVSAHVGQIEAALSLGAPPQVTVAPYSQTAMESSMIPRIDALASLGIVWIPGLMAGMLIAKADPIYAAVYQFAVITMIFASSAITSLAAVVLLRKQAFSSAEQLLLRTITPPPRSRR